MTDQSIEQVAVDQRAIDPRLEMETPEPVAAPEDIVETPVATEEVVPPVKPKKTAEEVLKGRVGHLTKTLSAKDEAIAAANRRAEAAEALLAASQRSVTESEQPVVTTPNSPTYTQEQFKAAVAQEAEIREFNRRADDLYNSGAAKYTDWKDSVDILVASGFMNKDLLDAAMAIEDGSAVLHHLGTNLDEAERINTLSPIRKAAEMAKLSQSLSTQRAIAVSSAPAPIKPVSGSANPQVDLQRVADIDDMKAYAAARAKQGSRWARGR